MGTCAFPFFFICLLHIQSSCHISFVDSITIGVTHLFPMPMSRKVCEVLLWRHEDWRRIRTGILWSHKSLTTAHTLFVYMYAMIYLFGFQTLDPPFLVRLFQHRKARESFYFPLNRFTFLSRCLFLQFFIFQLSCLILCMCLFGLGTLYDLSDFSNLPGLLNQLAHLNSCVFNLLIWPAHLVFFFVVTVQKSGQRLDQKDRSSLILQQRWHSKDYPCMHKGLHDFFRKCCKVFHKFTISFCEKPRDIFQDFLRWVSVKMIMDVLDFKGFFKDTCMHRGWFIGKLTAIKGVDSLLEKKMC